MNLRSLASVRRGEDFGLHELHGGAVVFEVAGAGLDAEHFWDAENRLITTNINGVAGSYAYNGDGLRTNRTIGGDRLSYVWDLAAPLPQIVQDSAGNRYVYGLDLISRIDANGIVEYHLSDGLGSTTGLANARAR